MVEYKKALKAIERLGWERHRPKIINHNYIYRSFNDDQIKICVHEVHGRIIFQTKIKHENKEIEVTKRFDDGFFFREDFAIIYPQLKKEFLEIVNRIKKFTQKE